MNRENKTYEVETKLTELNGNQETKVYICTALTPIRAMLEAEGQAMQSPSVAWVKATRVMEVRK